MQIFDILWMLEVLLAAPSNIKIFKDKMAYGSITNQDCHFCFNGKFESN